MTLLQIWDMLWALVALAGVLFITIMGWVNWRYLFPKGDKK